MYFPMLIAAGLAASAGAQLVCNGNATFCNRKFSNVSLIGDHDSAFVGTFVTDNQQISVIDQLNSGIRFMQGQVHSWLNTLYLCHTSCWEENSGPLVNYLETVKSFMDANPNEVITLLLTNGDNVPITTWGDIFVKSGISKYAFSPNKTLAIDEWPTLEQFISNGTRLVTFMDYGANPTQIPYILDEFTYYFETPYDTTDATFPECTIDRPPNLSIPDSASRMYIVNHFLDIGIGSITFPDYAHESITNAATGTGSIGAQAGLCEGIYGRVPNVVLIDSSSFGDWRAAQVALNGGGG